MHTDVRLAFHHTGCLLRSGGSLRAGTKFPLSLCLLHRDNTEFTAVYLKHQLDEKATLELPEVTYSLNVS